jgi:hypothetical protein
VAEGQTLTFEVSASDPDGDPLTFTVDMLPEEATFDPATLVFDPVTRTWSQTFQWTADFTQAGDYSLIFQVEDGRALTDVGLVNVQVQDKATPKNVKTANLLDIYFPQDGVKVPENDEWWVGSFTVLNLNDTDGNGQVDLQQFKPVLARQAALAADVKTGATTITVQGAENLFPALVNNAPNRIRLRDDYNAELLYIESVKGNQITLKSPVKDDYRAAQNGTVEIGEVDLIPIRVLLPQGAKAGDSIQLSAKGNVQLYESDNKGTGLLNKQGQANVIIDKDFLQRGFKWVYLEARVDLTKENRLPDDMGIATQLNAQGIRGIVIEAKFGKDVDTVRATAVWAIRTNFWNQAKEVVQDGKVVKTLHGDVDPNGAMMKLFKSRLDGDLGMGIYNGLPAFLTIGGRQESEFTLLPRA